MLCIHTLNLTALKDEEENHVPRKTACVYDGR